MRLSNSRCRKCPVRAIKLDGDPHFQEKPRPYLHPLDRTHLTALGHGDHEGDVWMFSKTAIRNRGSAGGGRAWVVTTALSVSMLVFSCADADPGPHPRIEQVDHLPFGDEGISFSDVFDTSASVILLDTDSVSMLTSVSEYGDEHFLLSDPRSAVVRVYSEAGDLVGTLGQSDLGSGELVVPFSVRGAPNGDVLIADSGRITRFSTPLSELGESHRISTVASPVNDPIGVWDLTAGRYLLAGSVRGSTDLFHVWNSVTGVIERSFFATPVAQGRVMLFHGAFALADADLRGDTLWTLFAFSDTIYQFTTSGSRIGEIPIPSVGILGGSAVPKSGWLGGRLRFSIEDDVGYRTQLTDIFALPDGDVVVQSLHVSTESDRLRWSLLIVNRQGAVIAQVHDSPWLRLVRDDLFHFQGVTTSDQGRRWIVGPRRAGYLAKRQLHG